MPEPLIVIEPIAVKKTTTARMLECGLTKIYDLIEAGKLTTIKVGSDDRVTVDSIRKFVAAGGDQNPK